MAWWDDNWRYKRPLHFTTAESTTTGPVLFVRMKADFLPPDSSVSNGWDLRFVSESADTAYGHYKVFWDDTSFTDRGALFMVHWPQSQSGVTDTLWVYFGNPSTSEGSDAAHARDDMLYQALWTFEGSGPTFADHLGNMHLFEGEEALFAKNDTSCTQLGLFSVEATGPTQYLMCPQTGCTDNINDPANFQLEMVFFSKNIPRRAHLVAKPERVDTPVQRGGWAVGNTNFDPIAQDAFFWSRANTLDPTFSLPPDNWYNLIGVIATSQLNVTYIDGVRKQSENTGAFLGSGASQGLYVFNLYPPPNDEYYFDGKVAWLAIRRWPSSDALPDFQYEAYVPAQYTMFNEAFFTSGAATGNSGYDISAAPLRPDLCDLIEVVTFG